MRAPHDAARSDPVWNRSRHVTKHRSNVPLVAEFSRRGKKWYRKSLVLRDRIRMSLGRSFRGGENRNPKAALAACPGFPIYSHTFVYQEMMSLRDMGMDIRLLCWFKDDTSGTHAAFQHLIDNCHVIQPIWEYHVADVEHFRATRPGRLESFLVRLSAETGKKVEELENEALVLQGCTFARWVERMGADYIHTYFFYDQSLMGMLAAWLLDLPRGVSCYADHMLDDYPFKLVALHVETADVIVATSRRIKAELLEITGGRWADKILVKPNGVDGSRFAVGEPCAYDGSIFELVSICRIEPKKGLMSLAEALSLLRGRGLEVRVHKIGSVEPLCDGSVEYGQLLERRIEELGVGDLFVMHGYKKLEEMLPILARAHAFVAPYVETELGDKDGIPTAMLEAMASGLPVVTTDSGSIVEVIDDGVEGLICAQHAPEQLADAIERLARDEALRHRMGRQARERFDREFDARVTEPRLHARIRELLESRARV